MNLSVSRLARARRKLRTIYPPARFLHMAPQAIIAQAAMTRIPDERLEATTEKTPR